MNDYPIYLNTYILQQISQFLINRYEWKTKIACNKQTTKLNKPVQCNKTEEGDCLKIVREHA